MLLDFAIGLLIGLSAAFAFAPEQLTILVIGGIVFALLPDVDFVIHRLVWRRPEIFDYLHRNILHKPLVYIPVGGLIVGFLVPGPMVIVFVCASLWHFVHDSHGVGYGNKWLWPFSSRYYGFFHGGLAWIAGNKPVVWIRSLSAEEVDAFVRARHEEYKDQPEHRSWIRNTYTKLTPIALLEYGVFAVVAALVAWYFMV